MRRRVAGLEARQASYQQREGELLESLAFQKELADAVTGLQFATDSRLRCTFWNGACERLTGIKAIAALGRKIDTIFPDSETARDAIGQYLGVLKTGESQNFVIKFPLNGEEQILRVNASPIKSGLSIFAINVTERYRTAEALKESENNFRNLMDSSPFGIRILNIKDGNRLYCNRAYLDMFGVDSVEELNSIPLEKRLAPESYAGHLQRLEQRKQGQPPVPSQGEERLIRKNGEIRHVAVHRKPIMWGGGLHEQTYIYDITDRKLAEEELRKTSDLLSKTFSSLRDALFVVDAGDRTILTCNEAAERMFGYPRDVMVGRNTEFLYPSKQDYEENGRKYFLSLDEKGIYHAEYPMRRADGTIFPTETRITPMIDDSGDRSRVVALVTDMTEEKQAREALAQSEKRSQMKSEILSNMSHELKSPLTSIKGIIDSLSQKDVSFDSQTRDLMLTAMSEEVERLIRLVEDLLHMSKIEAGVWAPRKAVSQIGEIISDVVGRQRLVHQGRVFELEMAPSLPPVSLDRSQIRQVLTNLISNSLAYADAGSPIGIKARLMDQWVEVSVRDQGAGILPEELDRIFEKFYRGPNQSRAHGTGLGLAICRAIIKAHGGRIWAESEPGRGSTFYFRLPLG